MTNVNVNRFGFGRVDASAWQGSAAAVTADRVLLNQQINK